MAHFDQNGSLPFIMVLSCFAASFAEIVVQEGSSLLIEEGTKLNFTCSTNTNASIDFLFNTSLIGTCFYSLGKCSPNDIFNLSANIDVPPYQYGLTSKTGVNSSFCGTYFCRDVRDTFRDSLEVSVTAFDNETYDFVEEENRISLTTSCIINVTKDDIQVEWFIFDNITLTKLNLLLLTDFVKPFTTETICPNISCGSSGAQNISTGLIFKSTTETSAYVYLEIQLSHPHFPTKLLTQRTKRTYSLNVVAGVPDQSDKGLGTDDIILIVIFSVFGFIVVIILFDLFMACCFPQVCPCITICIIAIAIYCLCQCCKRRKTIFWKVHTGEQLDRLCIAGCQQTICEIDRIFCESLSKRWKIRYCKEWNNASITDRNKLFSFDEATIKQLWQDKNARSKALSCFFKNATPVVKTEIFIKILQFLKVDRRAADMVFTGWLKLDASHQKGFLPALGQCTKIISLLWLHLKWRLKFKLFLHFWTSLNTDVQNAICEMIFNSKIAKQELIGRTLNVAMNAEIITNKEKSQYEKIETVEQLQSLLSKCKQGQCLEIFKEFYKKFDFKEYNEKFDELFQKLSKDLKLKMMGYTDQPGTVFVSSEFWQKWSEHKMEIPVEEVHCVGLFISRYTEDKSTIMCLIQMDWKNIKKVLTFSMIGNICLHLEWANISEVIRNKWMNDLLNKCETQRYLYDTTEQNEETSQRNTIACKGEGFYMGITRIQLYFDENASRTEEPYIAATIESTTFKPLCEYKDFNKIIVRMLEMFELALYLRRIPGWEVSVVEVEKSILTAFENMSANMSVDVHVSNNDRVIN